MIPLGMTFSAIVFFVMNLVNQEGTSERGSGMRGNSNPRRVPIIERIKVVDYGYFVFFAYIP